MSNRVSTLDAFGVDFEATEQADPSADRRRYTVASAWGLGIGFIPFIWTLWGGRLDPLRTALPGGAGSNFYDAQARALFAGHWDLPKDVLGIEAFVIDGRRYTYFGPFAAFLRMPLLAVTDAFDGKLTAPSMLLAWLVTGLTLVLLMWRVRHFLRGPAHVTRPEAVITSAFVATVMGGSVLVYLAALPWVYHEDLAWSVALVTLVCFTLLGVLEQPTARRVVLLGVFTACAVLNRASSGWACVIAVLIAAAWFGMGRGGEQYRRWWRALLLAGAVPLLLGCVVTAIKFGTPFGLPMADQVWTQMNQHRRDMLSANGGWYFSPAFLPSTLLAYFKPTSLRFTSLFPFITLPAVPARAVGGAVLDQTYRTTSLPASMPLLFLLGSWGVVTAFRPRALGLAKLVRIPVIGALIGTTGVMVVGHIANRYLADFMPLLIIAGAVGLVDVTRRIEGRRLPVRAAVVAATALCTFGIVANLALAIGAEAFSGGPDEASRYVRTQEWVSDSIGGDLNQRVVLGDTLPAAGPADELFVLGRCTGLYISNGESQLPWIAVELPEVHLALTVRGPTAAIARTPLLTFGTHAPFSTLSIEGTTGDRVRLRMADPWGPSESKWINVQRGRAHQLVVTVDEGRGEAVAAIDGHQVLVGWNTAPGTRVALNTKALEPGHPFEVTKEPAPKLSLCSQLRDAKLD
jgi:hypothetical protein